MLLTTARRRFAAAATTTVTAALLALGASSGASAYTITASSQVAVQPSISKVQGAHYNIGSAVTGPMWKQQIYQPGPIVSRQTQSGQQVVKVTYRLYRWSGTAWVLQERRAGSATILAGQGTVRLPALNTAPAAGRGYYSVGLDLVWTSQIGSVIASQSIAMNQAADYVCNTTLTCSTGVGWVYLG
ncbi:MAG: hypothetical protein ABIM89_10690 [Mycobacteriales bacterium]